jgi:hypothetical protein
VALTGENENIRTRADEARHQIETLTARIAALDAERAGIDASLAELSEAPETLRQSLAALEETISQIEQSEAFQALKLLEDKDALRSQYADAVDGYISVSRTWRAGEALELNMDMPVRLVHAHPRVREDAGRLAVARGPMVYCLEEADNGPDLLLVRLEGIRPERFTATWRPEKLGGIVELTCTGARETDEGFGDALYMDAPDAPRRLVKLTFIPYYSWANRQVGEMRVWVRN